MTVLVKGQSVYEMLPSSLGGSGEYSSTLGGAHRRRGQYPVYRFSRAKFRFISYLHSLRASSRRGEAHIEDAKHSEGETSEVSPHVPWDTDWWSPLAGDALRVSPVTVKGVHTCVTDVNETYPLEVSPGSAQLV